MDYGGKYRIPAGTKEMMHVSEKYHPRPISFQGVTELLGVPFRVFEICYRDCAIDNRIFDEGMEFCASHLTSRHSFRNSPAGFLIKHAGKDLNYFIVNYWANENECFNLVFIYQNGQWRSALDESFCVWDLLVMSGERDCYVANVLHTQGEVDIQKYLNALPKLNEQQ